MSDNGSMVSMFNPETHYSIRVQKEVNGYAIMTGYILKADSAGLWLDWTITDPRRKVYLPFTNVTHIEEREY